MTIRRRSLLPSLLLLAAGAARGEQPAVRVAFVLAEPVYRDEYTAAETAAIEGGLTRELVRRLSDEIRFLHFVEAGAAPYLLSFRLGNPQASRDEFHDVFFDVQLSGPQISTRPVAWLFRDHDQWGVATGEAKDFQDAMRVGLEAHGLAELVEPLFSSIPIATGGRFMRSPMRWVLPFRRLDLCMERQSRVRLATTVDVDGSDTSVDYFVFAAGDFKTTVQDLAAWRENMLCLPFGADGADLLQNADPTKVRIDGVFVARYLRMSDGCRGPLPPSEAVAGAGGGT